MDTVKSYLSLKCLRLHHKYIGITAKHTDKDRHIQIIGLKKKVLMKGSTVVIFPNGIIDFDHCACCLSISTSKSRTAVSAAEGEPFPQ